MTLWKTIQTPVLALTCGATFVVLGHSLLSPSLGETKKQAYTLPEQVPLTGWQLVSSAPLSDPPGRNYEYQQGKQRLAIAMRYVDHPHPNEKLFRQYDPEAAAPGSAVVVHRQDQVGFYSLSVEAGQAYLRSCINPRGESAITYGQFIQNRYSTDLQPGRLFRWLSGHEPIRDHRCFWTHMSVSLNQTAPETAYQLLEKAWPDWHRWWHSQFP